MVEDKPTNTQSRNETEGCSFCSCLQYHSSEGGNDALVRRQVFHSMCADCPSIPSALLCGFCKHLRLYHQLFCPRRETDLPAAVKVDISHIVVMTDTELRKCKLCDYFHVIAMGDVSRLRLADQKHAEFKIILDLDYIGADTYTTLSMETYADDALVEHIPTKSFNLYAIDRLTDAERFRLRENAYLSQTGIDWSRTASWIRRCSETHACCDTSPLYTPTQNFRLIDTLKRCVAQIGVPTAYLALSYVWGPHPDRSKLMAKRSNIKLLEAENSLHAAAIPSAINDAITASAMLGFRYVWVDRLCIIQDDDESRDHNIAQMQHIYAKAAAVLIDFSNDNCDDSMAGISRHRMSGKFTVDIDNLHITTISPTLTSLAAWTTRGWTYQEAVLAKRRLMFTESQVVFSCQQGIVYEDNLLNKDHLELIDIPERHSAAYRIYPLKSGIKQSTFGYYANHLQAYKMRQLSNKADMCDAFLGITTGLYGKIDTIHHGLPTYDLDEALLWHVHNIGNHIESRRRDEVIELQLDSNIPSWSWAKTAMHIEHLTIDICYVGPLVQWWYCRQTNDGPRWYAAQSSHESDGETINSDAETYESDAMSSSEALLYGAVGLLTGCFDSIPQPHLTTVLMSSFEVAAESLHEVWPSLAWLVAQLIDDELPHLCRSVDSPRQDVLVTRAQIASFALEAHLSNSSRYQGWNEIVDDKGDHVGMLAAADVIGEDLTMISGLSMMAISLGAASDHIMVDLVCDKLQEGTNYNYQDKHGVSLDRVPVVFVMCIRRTRDYFARVSVGWILLTAWARTTRRIESIALL